MRSAIPASIPRSLRCTIPTPISSSPGLRRKLRAGDTQGRRTRLETEILPRQYRNHDRLGVEARRPGIFEGDYLDGVPKGSDRSDLEGRSRREEGGGGA